MCFNPYFKNVHVIVPKKSVDKFGDLHLYFCKV